MQRQSTEDEVAINYRDVGWSVNQSYHKLKHGSSRQVYRRSLNTEGEGVISFRCFEYVTSRGIACKNRNFNPKGAVIDDDDPYELHKMLGEKNIHTVIKLSSNLNSNVITVRTKKSSNPTEFPEYTALKEIQVGGGRFKRKGVWKPASHTTKRIAAVDALHGHLKEIKQLFSKQVLNHKGLSGLYIDYAETSDKGLREIFSILSDTDSLPALVHCEQGKDRTGVVVALILSACGVDREVILDDYGKSKEGLHPQYTKVKHEMNGLGLNDEFAHTEPEALQEMLAHLENTYSLKEFFADKCQISPDVLTKVRQNLIVVSS